MNEVQLYRLTWTLDRHGQDPANGEKFLEGFVNAHPEVGAVVSQNTATGHLSVTFSFEAKDFDDALARGKEIFVAGASLSELEPADIVDLTVSLASAEDYEPDRELQLA